MSDWDEFTEKISWFLDEDATVKVGAPRSPHALPPATAALFPKLAELFRMSTVTDVSVNRTRYELLAWNSLSGGRMGWLCLPPPAKVPDNLYEDHRELLTSFGGILERFNEPENTWLSNHDAILTKQEGTRDASFIEHYKWAWEEEGLTIPIELSEYYSIASEANGNTTLCHRVDGKVLMFAPDHDFDHIKVLKGCPEQSLYTISGAPTFRKWVNTVASQWLSHVQHEA